MAAAERTAGIEARFFCGVPDASGLPGAYKGAASLRRPIDGPGLARGVDTVEPVGCIMAGDGQAGAPPGGAEGGGDAAVT